jgi:hypothetical protein
VCGGKQLAVGDQGLETGKRVLEKAHILEGGNRHIIQDQQKESKWNM